MIHIRRYMGSVVIEFQTMVTRKVAPVRPSIHRQSALSTALLAVIGSILLEHQ
jgi:hypothetical protein